VDLFAAFILRCIRWFPLRVLRRFAKGLGIVTYHFAHSRRHIALSNLDLAYGNELTQGEKIRLAKGCFVNLITTGLELCYAPKLPRPIGNMVDPTGKEHCLRAHANGKGVLLLVLHMGNWEVCARWLTENIPVVHVVVRRQKQEWVERVVHRLRSDIGLLEIDKRNGLRGVLAALRRGELVVLAIDQHAHEGAVEVEFFGRPAMTSATAAVMAVRMDCSVLVGACHRNPDGGWGCCISEPFETIRTADRRHDYVANTQRYVKVMETLIREHPADWMWMHRRWRPGRKRTDAITAVASRTLPQRTEI